MNLSNTVEQTSANQEAKSPSGLGKENSLSGRGMQTSWAFLIYPDELDTPHDDQSNQVNKCEVLFGVTHFIMVSFDDDIERYFLWLN